MLSSPGTMNQKSDLDLQKTQMVLCDKGTVTWSTINQLQFSCLTLFNNEYLQSRMKPMTVLALIITTIGSM